MRLFVNVINGGRHAGNNLDIQEYLVIPKAENLREATRVAADFYRALREALAKRKGPLAANLGDEGGFAPNFKDNLEPLRIMKTVARALRVSGKVDFGIDAAASSMRRSAPRFALYAEMRRQFGIIYLEDPFPEDDFGAHAKLRAKLGKQVLVSGDDLTATNVARMEEARTEGSINAVIIKPNQIGTVSEALAAVRFARENGWAVVASHRSGETNDDFIADFAYGAQADGIKLGAPARGERIAKYNRLLEIEEKE
jgi:enolase